MVDQLPGQLPDQLPMQLPRSELIMTDQPPWQGTPPTQPLRLAPWWLERLMAFIYPFSMGVDEGIAHLFLRAEVAMSTQCDVGGCSSAVFILSAAIRWSTSLATSFWLIVVFRRSEAAGCSLPPSSPPAPWWQV